MLKVSNSWDPNSYLPTHTAGWNIIFSHIYLLVRHISLKFQKSWLKCGTIYTGCPIDMLTTSDQILKIEKSHMPKSKPCFEILE